MPTNETTNLAESTEDTAFSEQLAFATITKTVLKLTNQAVLQKSLDSPAISAQILAAMQRLIEIVTQLRSPTGGWPADLQQTPENLTPYVAEEAYEVLNLLSQELESAIPGYMQVPTSGWNDFHRFLQRYFLIENLIPRLLWYIVRSSYDVMLLLEGVKVSIRHSDQDWQSGILRLVPALEVKAPQIDWLFDLVTHQSPQEVLPLNTIIQSEDRNICQQPSSIEKLVQQLTQKLKAITPEVERFLDQVKADLLEPEKNWQVGSIELKLGLAFMADTEINPTLNTTSPLAGSEVSPESAHQVDESEGQPLTLKELFQEQQPDQSQVSLSIAGAIVKLTDRSTLSNLREVMLRQQMQSIVRQLKVAPTLDPLLSPVVEIAYNVSTMDENSTVLSEYNFLQPELLVDEWMPKFLWHLTRSSYEVMQLIGGVRARVLHPGKDWNVGLLRLLAVLRVSASNTSWAFDLATGQLLPAHTFILDAAAVVQSDESDLCQELQRVEQVMTELLNSIREVSPLIKMLIDGTGINLLQSDGDWQSGLIQLDLALSLIPNVIDY